MNRCQLPQARLNRRQLFSTLAGAGLFASAVLGAHADEYMPLPRSFPPTAQLATMVVMQSPELLLNAVPDRFSPGARIHDSNNRLVTPATLTGQRTTVSFVREPNGMVHEVWILTPQELAQAQAQADALRPPPLRTNASP